jgi:hypothetical protein
MCEEELTVAAAEQQGEPVQVGAQPSDSEGNLPMPQSFLVRMASSTLAWIR